MSSGPVPPTGSTEQPPPPAIHWRWWLLACVLLALVQVQWAGYQLGAGNQSVQIPFLERLHDPSLFPRDEMVNQTLDRYPTHFFSLLAPALRLVRLGDLYLALHLLTAAAVLAGAAALAWALTRSHGAAFWTVLFLLAGHQQALAETTLYAGGFTHTWAVFPWLLVALACWYADRPWWAFGLTGLLVNVHALEAGMLAVVLTVWAVGTGLVRRGTGTENRERPPGSGTAAGDGDPPGPADQRRGEQRRPRRPRCLSELVCRLARPGWWRVAGLVGLLVVLAAPTLWLLLRDAQSFGAQWLEWTRLRSALHSFPSAWWRPGNPSVPRFAMLAALAVVSCGLLPFTASRRRTRWLVVTAAVMWMAGTLFTELWPVPLVVRAQFFRSSRLLAVVALAWVATGCVRAWALPFARDRLLVPWRAWLEFLQATVTALALFWPPAVILLPVALVAAVLAALINGRLSWLAALVAGSALLLVVAGWQQIQFVVPGLSRGFHLAAVLIGQGPGWIGWMLVAASAALWLFTRRRWPGWLEALVAAAGVLVAVAVVGRAWPDWQAPSPADADWWSAQRWARANTPRDALFLTPIQQGGFRIFSRRSVVAEWRDGTQLYFSAAFGPAWWERINALQPGMRAAPDGLRLLVRGRSLGEQTDGEVIALAKRYAATHVVLPADANRRLTVLYTNATWAIHEPVLAPPALALPADQAKQAAFLRDVVDPNIRQHRQSDVRLQVVGSDGRPLYDATYRVVQTNSAFLFGVSLPPFAPAAGADRSPHDRQVPPVSTAQLARVRGVFNFSVVTRSAWWSSLEPEDGQRRYDDLAQYLGWCQTNGLAVEFSFLSGLPPRWWHDRPDAEQGQRFERHAQDVVQRFGDQVDFWEVTNRGWLWAATTNVMAGLREKHPGIKLGLSDAARFASDRDPAGQQTDRERGLADVRRLQEQGTALDFVAVHGHQPWGTPADVATMYEVLDAFAKEGVPIHITEFAAPAAGPRADDPRAGPWDPRRQADYCRVAYTTFFSHPGVAAVNYAELGPVTRLPAAGLLDPEGRPRPVYDVLRDLITRQWRSRLQGRLPLDGRVGFRGFHGDYELEVTLKNGRSARAAFRVAPAQENVFRFEFDAAAGRLVAAE